MSTPPLLTNVAEKTGYPHNRLCISDRSTVFCLALAAIASLIPVLSVRFPPMTDYANHYVRMWLLAGGIDRPQMAAFYAIDWNVAWTNIAIDLVAVVLGKIFSMEVIGPVVLASALLLPPIGATLLNRKLFGGFHWWQLLCFILAWNSVFLFGFLSFSISLGLALIFAYLNECLKGRGITLLFGSRIVWATLLLIAHPFGLLFFITLLAGLAFGPSGKPLRQAKAMLAAVLRVVFAITPVFVPLLAFLLLGPSLPGEKDASLFAGMYWDNPSPIRSLLILLTYFRTYDARIDMLYLVLMIIIVREAVRHALLRAHCGLVLVAIVTGLLSMIMPTQVFDTGGIDVRLPCMMALAAAAGLRPHARGRIQSFVLPLVLLVVISRIAFIEYVWLQRTSDVRAVENVLKHVQPSAAILPASLSIDADNMMDMPVGRMVGGMYPSFNHYPALASLDRDAFMPYLFTAAGKQPLRVKAPWNEIAVPEGVPVPFRLLNEPASFLLPYMKDWTGQFDYVLVLNADMEPVDGDATPLRDILQLVADEGFARLYRITRLKMGTQ